MTAIRESFENTDFTSIWTWLGFVKYIIPLLLAYIITRYLDKKLSNRVLHGQLYLVVAKSLLRAAVWIAAFFVTLSFIPSFTKTWETIFASSGIAAVVLSLAAQKTFSNMITGITISASKSRPFDIGDWIRIGSYQDGTVIDMTLRHIVIRTVNEEEIFIPNSVVDSESVINYTQGGSTMYTIEISVAYGNRVQEAMDIMADVIAGHPLYAGPVPAAVFCTECGDSGVNLTGRVVTKQFADNYRTRSDCLVMLMKRYDEAGIEIPYNKLELLKPSGEVSAARTPADGKQKAAEKKQGEWSEA